jgi:hypothetical protein
LIDDRESTQRNRFAIDDGAASEKPQLRVTTPPVLATPTDPEVDRRLRDVLDTPTTGRWLPFGTPPRRMCGTAMPEVRDGD